jgi:1-acyl-sn-glycerol-3-phosphate acyltransferase
MKIRAPLRVAAAGGLSGAILAALTIEELLHEVTEERRNGFVRRWARSLLGVLGVDVQVDGALGDVGASNGSHGVVPRLVVANHRSTIDILLMLHLFGGQLLARGDMATWPGIGVMARRAGTLFVDRDDPASGAGAVQRMRERLRRGISIGVFPEGTTFPGDEVREFQAGAFMAIAREKGIVLPVGIAYHDADAIYGDEPIADHLKRVLQTRATSVGVAVGTPISATGTGIAGLAQHAHDEVQRLVHRARSLVGRGRP